MQKYQQVRDKVVKLPWAEAVEEADKEIGRVTLEDQQRDPRMKSPSANPGKLLNIRHVWVAAKKCRYKIIVGSSGSKSWKLYP